MSWSSYTNKGTLVERGDDVTRTVTTYDSTGVPTTRPYTADENADADAEALSEAAMSDGQWLDVLKSDYIARHVITDPNTAPEWASQGAYPQGAVVSYDGSTWTNNSGVTLNGSYIPGDALHPFWTKDAGDAPVTDFAEGIHLIPGDLYRNPSTGDVYRYKGADTASAPANWLPTTTNATWELIPA